MKAKIMYLVVACFLLFSISIAEALPQYTVNQYPGNGTSGGPFIIDPVGGGANFNTFCVETNEYISYGGTYWGSIESDAIYGGAYVDTYGGTPSGISTTDPISDNTKKLYAYALDNWGSLNLAQLTAIQAAIWAYEAEIPLSSLSGDALTYYNAAPGYILDRNIMVLNLWNGNVSPPYDNSSDYNLKAQSMLIQVPEPGILILLGIAMSAIGMASWRIRKI
jgi:hypothetical protein